MIVTMLEAQVVEESADELISSFRAGTDSLPTPIRESFLLRESGTESWRIVTVWESQEALDGYQASVDTPGGVLMFRSVGAEPVLKVFETEAHADHA